MRKLLQLVLALSLAGGVLGVQGSAQADHCPEEIYVFSSRKIATIDDPTTGGTTSVFTPAYAIGATGCQDPDAHADTNYILPHADHVSVRYLFNVGEEVLLGKVNGLGFEDVEFELRQGLDATGAQNPFYDSPRLEIDFPASGELVVEVYIPLSEDEFETVSVTYRTFDQG